MRCTRSVWLLPALLLACASPALAWGAKTHTLVVYNAIKLLPEGPLRDYMEANSKRITGYAMAPDFQLSDGLAGELERADHYINLENLGDAGTPDGLPRTRSDVLRLCIERGVAPSDIGFLPWRLETSYLDLAAAFAADPDDAPLRAGLLAHYAADATMPLHTTADYDGRRPEPGSDSTEKRLRGIHFQYEVVFVEDSGFEYAREALDEASEAEPIPDVFKRAVSELFTAYALVDTLYACAEGHLDDLASWDAEIGDMTRSQLARASQLIASLWLSAWEEAGQPGLDRA